MLTTAIGLRLSLGLMLALRVVPPACRARRCARTPVRLGARLGMVPRLEQWDCVAALGKCAIEAMFEGQPIVFGAHESDERVHVLCECRMAQFIAEPLVMPLLALPTAVRRILALQFFNHARAKSFVHEIANVSSNHARPSGRRAWLPATQTI